MGLFNKLLWSSICADSLSFLIFQCFPYLLLSLHSYMISYTWFYHLSSNYDYLMFFQVHFQRASHFTYVSLGMIAWKEIYIALNPIILYERLDLKKISFVELLLNIILILYGPQILYIFSDMPLTSYKQAVFFSLSCILISLLKSDDVIYSSCSKMCQNTHTHTHTHTHTLNRSPTLSEGRISLTSHTRYIGLILNILRLCCMNFKELLLPRIWFVIYFVCVHRGGMFCIC